VIPLPDLDLCATRVNLDPFADFVYGHGFFDGQIPIVKTSEMPEGTMVLMPYNPWNTIMILRDVGLLDRYDAWIEGLGPTGG
jgi:hypothetical protein